MIKYDFKVNKNVCFAYWIQSIIKWNWYFDKNEFLYYENITGKFTKKEKDLLENFKKKILNREPDGGYLWLWARYNKEPIKKGGDKILWKSVKTQFKSKFDTIWEKEYPKLIQWQKILQKYDLSLIQKIFPNIEIFFGIKRKKNVSVELCLEYRESQLSAHVKKEFKNLILFNVSNLAKNFDRKIAHLLIHETSHLIHYASKKDDLLKNSYLKIIKPQKIKQSNPSWAHLLNESIITSIASVNTNFDYFSQKFTKIKNTQDKKNINKFTYRGNEKKYHYQIRAVAYLIKDLTKEYLDNNKELDDNYCDQVAQAWINFRS